MNLFKRFAVIKLWDTPCAEDENIMRLIESAKSLGIECIPVNKYYQYLSDPSKVADEKNFDFILHLHFESLKINNLFSFVTLWNPTQFFYDWGYRRYSEHLLTHDDFLTSHAEGAENHIQRLLYKDSFHLPPVFELFPSSSEFIFPPVQRKDKRLHYCGINWEKAGSNKSRHGNLLSLLDKKDIINIYGPKKIGEKELWAEFHNYKGEVPFDGHSMIQTIQQAGVSLVLSSPAHLESKLMSNRLFEALAAGANIICDENYFAKKYMGDTILYVSSHETPEKLAKQIEDHVSWLNENPQKAYEMAVESQQIFRTTFDLKSKLKNIYDNLIERKRSIAQLSMPKNMISVRVCFICFDKFGDIENIKSSIDANMHESISFYIYCYKEQESLFKQKFSYSKNIYIMPFKEEYIESPKDIHLGKVITDFLNIVKTDEKFLIAMQNEILMKDHILSLLKVFEEHDCDLAYSNYITIENCIKNKKEEKIYIPQTSAPVTESCLGMGVFLLKKELYEQTYSDSLPYIKKFIPGYFYALSTKNVPSYKFSCHIDCSKIYFKKSVNDLELLTDLKINKNNEVFYESFEIAAKQEKSKLENIALMIKPLLKKLPYYEQLKAKYMLFKNKYISSRKITVQYKVR